MGTPTRDDPLGLAPDPLSFDAAIGQVVDARIAEALRGRTGDRFNGIPDMDLVRELLARGWAVFKPTGQNAQL